jgi:hypothetical protein
MTLVFLLKFSLCITAEGLLSRARARIIDINIPRFDVVASEG